MTLPMLIKLEGEGPAAAHGTSPVHLDLYAFNTLIRPDGVFFVDWPHARLPGRTPSCTWVMLLSGASDEIDVEPILRRRPLAAQTEPHRWRARCSRPVLAAGGQYPARPEYTRIAEAKRHLSRGVNQRAATASRQLTLSALTVFPWAALV